MLSEGLWIQQELKKENSQEASTELKEKRKKNNMLKTNIVLIILLVIAVSFAGFFACKYFAQEQGWKTYEGNGFQLKYPPFWQVQQGQGSRISLLNEQVLDCIARGEYECTLWSPAVEVFTMSPKTGNSATFSDFEEWIEDKKQNMILNFAERIRIGKYEGFDASENGMIGYRSIYLFHDGRVAKFSIAFDADMTNFDKMISTFKFID